MMLPRIVCALFLRIRAPDHTLFEIDHTFAAKVLESLSQLVKIFLINDFAWDGSASLVKAAGDSPETAAGAEFCLTLVAPATVWGGKALQQQRAQLQNDFL
jgi:hypothetical protein